jgi:RNA polymerase sigma factor (sigma-70 family)
MILSNSSTVVVNSTQGIGKNVYADSLIKLYRRMEAAEEMACIRLIQNGSRAAEFAKEKIIASQARAIVRLANSYTAAGESSADLISVAIVALMETVAEFDPTRGVRLYTPAKFKMLAAVQDAHHANALIYVPVSQKKIKDTDEAKTKGKGRGKGLVTQAHLANGIVSMNSPMPGNSNATWMDTFSTGESPFDDDLFDRMAVKAALDAIKDETQKRCVTLRFGLDHAEESTIQEIADTLHVSTATVRLNLDKAQILMRQAIGRE